jgi:SAM-dependent methyltransferase
MWEKRYSASDGYLFGEEPAQFLLENPGWLRPGKTALSVADGEGRNSVHMATCGLTVTSFEPSETAVIRARALAEKRGVSVSSHQSDWDWSEARFDLVAAIFIQYADPETRAMQFETMKRTLRPGGVLMLHGYRPEQIVLGTGGPPDASQMYTLNMLADAFSDWRIERLAAYERDVQEGRGHSGKSALIDLIATKPA